MKKSTTPVAPAIVGTTARARADAGWRAAINPIAASRGRPAALLVLSAVLLAASALVGCSSEDTVDPELTQRTRDVPGFDFSLPCPVADFNTAFLFASNVGRDGIQAIDNPSYSPAASVTWLADEDHVLGVFVDGKAYAFPIRILVWHEVVNNVGPGGNLMVTYCPLTFSGITFDAATSFAAGSERLGVSGLLYNSNLVMFDRGSNTFWAQMSFSGYVGPNAGECLDVVQTIDTSFGFWKSLHPDTEVLDRPGGPKVWPQYGINPYDTYWSNNEVLFPVPQPIDGRLPAKEKVLGVLADTGQRAYPLPFQPVLNDTLPGVPFVVFTRKRDKTLVAYKAWVKDGERLTFAFFEGRAGVPHYTDDQTGSVWRFDGRCVEGPLAGNALEAMPSFLAFHFAWSSYYPDSEIHERTASASL